MEFEVECGSFLQSVKAVSSTIEARVSIPILSHVLLSANSSGAVSLRATNLDMEISHEASHVSVSTEGQATTSGRTLDEIFSRLPAAAKAKLKLDNDRIRIASGAARFTLPVLKPEDFPDSIAKGEDFQHSFKLSGSVLWKLLDAVRLAISREETRYYLNGVYLHSHEQNLHGVATDGHRLALHKCPAPEGASEISGVIIPSRAVDQLLRLLDEQTSLEVEISLSEEKARFVMTGENSVKAELVTRLISGRYPDYQRVIPTENNRDLVVDRKLFLDSVTRVTSVLLSDRVRGLSMSTAQNKLTLSSSSTDAGEAEEEIQVAFDEEESVEVGYNARFIEEIFRALKTDQAQFKWRDSQTPTLIRGVDEETTLYVVMPMRL